MNPEVTFVNKIVKQGNSLCVRIPRSIVKEENLREGIEVLMSLVPQEIAYDVNESIINSNLRIANKVHKLDKYSERQKRIFIVMNFRMLKELNGDTLNNKKLDSFLKSLRYELGNKFADEFISFEKTFNQEAFIMEKDGTAVLKKKFR